MPFHTGLEKLRDQIGGLIEQAKGFVSEKPIQTGAAILGIAAVPVGFLAANVIKRKARTRKKKKKSKTTRRKKRATHRSPRHKGHKRVTFTTKGGKKVRFLVKPKKHKHISHRRGKKARRFVKGSKEAKAFMAKLRRMRK